MAVSILSYENLDIQLERPVDQDIERIFDKIVKNGRGGWCYELNGLLHWVLEEIGFDVSRCVVGVLRNERGDAILGNHLILLVQLDNLYLADLGLGDGIREPVPIKPGSYVQGELVFRLEKLDDGYWRFHNHGFGDPTSFDFKGRVSEFSHMRSGYRNPHQLGFSDTDVGLFQTDLKGFCRLG